MRNLYSISIMILTRNIVTSLSRTLLAPFDLSYEGDFFWMPQLFVQIVVMLLVYFFVTKKMSKDVRFTVDAKSTIAILIITIFTLPMSSFEQFLRSNTVVYIYFQIVQILIDATLLTFQIILYYVSVSNIEKALEKHLLAEQITNSANFRDVVERMNIKVHDLKHQVRELKEGKKTVDDEYIDELEEAAKEYENFIDVGNENCNVVLTEKLHLCSLDNIRMTVMLNGEDLSFLTPADTYSLLGNLIENAIKYLKTVDKDKRFIRISCTTNIENVYILRIENYFEDALKLDENGLPITTQDDTLYHGYGVRSVANIAKKYGGQATFKAEDNLFKVTVVLVKA